MPWLTTATGIPPQLKGKLKSILKKEECCKFCCKIFDSKIFSELEKYYKCQSGIIELMKAKVEYSNQPIGQSSLDPLYQQLDKHIEALTSRIQ